MVSSLIPPVDLLFSFFLVSSYIYRLYFFVNKKSITLLLAFCTIFFLIFCIFFH
nr:MAG TPA: hypothetical protein [Caudoviricetes sp.]